MSVVPGEVCKVCGARECYAHCQEAADGRHQPEPSSWSVEQDGEGIWLDVNCRFCYQSGNVFHTMLTSEEQVTWG